MKREKSRPAVVPVGAVTCIVSISVMHALGMIFMLFGPASCIFWIDIFARVYICTSSLVASALMFTLAGICTNASVTARNSAMQVQLLDRLLEKAEQREVTFREIDTEKPSA